MHKITPLTNMKAIAHQIQLVLMSSVLFFDHEIKSLHNQLPHFFLYGFMTKMAGLIEILQKIKYALYVSLVANIALLFAVNYEVGLQDNILNTRERI